MYFMKTTPTYTLSHLGCYFLKLGTIGFGGPVALVAAMHKDLVENRKWISEEEYKEGIALAQLAPGPLAAQLGIYLGFVHYGLWGATLAGIAFVLPSFIMVVLIGMTYQLFGGLSWMQSVFYGVGAAVVAIILKSTYKLTAKTVGAFNSVSLRQNWLLWLLYLSAAITTFITREENMLLFIAAGAAYMLAKAPPKTLLKKTLMPLALLQTGFLHYDNPTLVKIAVFFLKAGAFVLGSGLAIVPFLHAGVVTEHRWLTENQFVDAVAVAMITPGPVVITVGFIGYLVAGFPGASVAALSTFLPCYLFTVLPAPYFKKISKNQSVKAFVDGITASVVGALAGTVTVIGMRSISDLTSAVIAVSALLALGYIKNIKEPAVILAAALIGLLLKL